MANTFTGLVADAFVAADIVGREIMGAVTSVEINTGAEQAAIGQNITSHFTQEPTVVDITPSMTIPEGTDQTVTTKNLTLTKQKAIQIPYTGEDVKFLNRGAGYRTVYGDQIRQAIRKLANLIEIDLCTTIYQNASRAVGVAGTTPFASDFDLVAEARQIIVDNGGDLSDASMVMNTLAGTNLRNLAQLQKANEAGGTDLLRNGVLLDLQGLMLKESAQIQAHTKGTGSGYLLNDAAHAVGDTAINVDTGSGTIVAGDIVTAAGDTTNKYVVNTALSGGVFSIGEPGSRIALADNAAITVGNNYTANFALQKNAAELAIRPPAVPEGGDAAEEMEIIVDPRSGLAFSLCVYKGYKKAMIEIAAVWGYKVWKPDFVVNILG